MLSSLWRRCRFGAWSTRARDDWTTLLGPNWPERIMTVPLTDRFHAKQGRSTGRWVIGHAKKSISVYLKRHYILPRWRGILATLAPGGHWSPAWQEWHHLLWAKSHGIPVPEPVAMGQRIGPLGKLCSFLAVEELPGMMALNEIMPIAAARLPPAAFRIWKRRLAIEVARLARELHDRRRFHKDLYLCHFYLPLAEIRENGSPCLRMIDFHRLGHHPVAWRWYQLKDLAQLLYSSELPEISIRDRMAFWRAYIGPTTRDNNNEWLRWLILLRWRRYRRHNRNRLPPSPAAAA